MKPKWLTIAGASTASAINRRKRIRLRAQTGGRCFYCGGPTFDRHNPNDRDWLLPGPGFELVREHRIPIRRGGSPTEENTVPACWSCNSEKGAFTADEFRTLRGLRRGDLNHTFAFEAARRSRDWIVVHSRAFEQPMMVAAHPGSDVAFAIRRNGSAVRRA